MILTEKYIEELLRKKNLKYIKTLKLNNINIQKIIPQNKYLNNLEFLSLENNKISEINFLEHLNFLWYLDLRSNPIQNYEILNRKNSFGFLGITIYNTNKDSILRLRNLQLGILYCNLENLHENEKFSFLVKNENNIFRVNNKTNLHTLNTKDSSDINEYSFKNENEKKNLLKDYFHKKNSLKYNKSDLGNINTIGNKIDNYNHLDSKISNCFYSKEINDYVIFSFEKEKYILYAKLIKSFLDMKKNTFYNCSEVKTHSYLNNPISDFFKLKNSSSIDLDFNLDIFIVENIEKQAIILILLIFNFFNVLSRDFIILLMLRIFKSFDNNKKNQTIIEFLNNFFNLNLKKQLCIYYYTLESFNKQSNLQLHLQKVSFLDNDELKLRELGKIFELNMPILNNLKKLKEKKRHFEEFLGIEIKQIEELDFSYFLKIKIKDIIIKPIQTEFYFLEEVEIF